MDNISLGFVGGCLNKQPGIEKADNYISIVRELLRKEGIAADAYTGLYMHYNEAVCKTAALLNRKPVNVLCFFMRPYPLLPLYKLWVKYPTTQHTVRSMLHPALFNRKAPWNVKLTENQQPGAFTYTPQRRFGYRDLNISLGLLCGLLPWVLRYLTQIIGEVKQACDEKGTKLIIITPPGSKDSIMGDYVCRKTAQAVNIFCLQIGINVIDINSLSANYFEEDLIHMNQSGHQQIAKMIFEKLPAHHRLIL